VLSHAICDRAQPNGGEEVDAETHVAGRVLYARDKCIGDDL